MSITNLKEAKKSRKNDGNLANNYPPYDKVTRGDVIAGRLGKDQMGGKRKFTSESKKNNDGNLANNYPPYDKVTRGDVIAGALGKDQMGGKRKKKSVKEGYSDWREDLSEVMEIVNKDKNDKKITEKKVNNKIKINPAISESVENLGGTLLEMIELDEIDYIIESVYEELINDGYEESDIEEAIEYALTEAKITYGHDTESQETEKKKKGLLSSAKERLSGLKKRAKQVVATSARKVAKGALGVARKIESGDGKPSSAHSRVGALPPKRPPSGAGQKEKLSSGTYSPPSTKKSDKISDPWEEIHSTQKPKSSSQKVASKTTKVKRGSEDKKRGRTRQFYLRKEAEKVIRGVKESNCVNKIKEIIHERKMTSAEKAKEERIGKKTKSALTAMKKEYGAEKGTQVYYAWKRKQAMKEDFVDEAKLPRSERKPKVQRTSKTHVIHDVDDNIADQRSKDAAKIDVMRKSEGQWKKIKSLTPSQFAHYNLRKPGEPMKEETDDPGDKYGFDEFRSTEKFKKTTKPNKPVARLGDSPRRSAKKSVVTARGGSPFGSKKPSTPMDKPGEFAKDLKTRIGVKGLERKNVHFTGGMKSGSGPEKKAKVVKQIVKPDAKKVIASDDHLQNVRHMASAAASAAPSAKVRAYQSRPATKASGKKKVGDIVPVRVGKEKDLGSSNIGIRSGADEPKTTKEKQRIRRKAMREELIARIQEKISEQALEMNPKKQEHQEPKKPTPDFAAINAAKKAKSAAVALKTRELQTLRQTPAGTNVPSFGG